MLKQIDDFNGSNISKSVFRKGDLSNTKSDVCNSILSGNYEFSKSLPESFDNNCKSSKSSNNIPSNVCSPVMKNVVLLEKIQNVTNSHCDCSVSEFGSLSTTKADVTKNLFKSDKTYSDAPNNGSISITFKNSVDSCNKVDVLSVYPASKFVGNNYSKSAIFPTISESVSFDSPCERTNIDSCNTSRRCSCPKDTLLQDKIFGIEHESHHKFREYNKDLQVLLPVESSFRTNACDSVVSVNLIHGEDEVDKAVLPKLESQYSLSLSDIPAKPLLLKTEAIEEESDAYKKLCRGISKATDNVNIVSKKRCELANCMWEAFESARSPFWVETPPFTLPNLSVYSDDFRAFLENDLIEKSTCTSLETVGRLNWWATIGASQRLWPLATTGDGNCLLHAASLGMWGFHDRLLTLRKALYEFISRKDYGLALWRRWRWQVTQQNRQTGLVYSSEEWEAEWNNILRLASSVPRGEKSDSPPNSQKNNSNSQNNYSSLFMEEDECIGKVYESLEEIHVLALAHVLRRPIIVVADTTLKDVSGQPLAPIPFGGIYLPLIFSPSECHRSPLLLAYDAAHFSALVVMDSNDEQDLSYLPAVIPVTDCHHELLPIQFVIDPGEDFAWGIDDINSLVIQKLTLTEKDKIGLLHEYLEVQKICIPQSYLDTAAAFSSDEILESPEYSHPDAEKKSSESSFDSDDSPPYSDSVRVFFGNRTKASKQLQTVAKQFGSIGKTVSKKIKRNLSKLGRAGSFRRKEMSNCPNKFANGFRVSVSRGFILAAVIHTEKRHQYQEELIKNYLSNAKERFQRQVQTQKVFQEKETKKQESISFDEPSVLCINPGCNLYGTASMSYMCSSCFIEQKEREQQYNKKNSPEETLHATLMNGPQYGAGRSQFYAEVKADSSRNINIPTSHALSIPRDKTLFLSNSTFYNDTNIAMIPSYNLSKTQSLYIKPTHTYEGKKDDAKGSVKSSISEPPVTMLRNVSLNNCVSNNSEIRTNAPVDVDETGLRTGAPLGGYSQCLNKTCQFFGTPAFNGFCSKCHRERKCDSYIATHAVNSLEI